MKHLLRYYKVKIKEHSFFHISFLLVLQFALLALSCQQTSVNRQKGSYVNIKIDRFEEDLFSISLYHLADSIGYLQQKYPDFFPLFTHKIIEIGNPGQEDISMGLLAFVSDFTIYRVSKRVKEVFPTLEKQENELSDAFSRYHSDFSDYTIPHVVSCISGFNQSIITADSLLAISLDKYLGSDDDFYRLLYPPVPEYLRSVMQPDKITSDAMLAWIITEFNYNNKTDNLLSQMIFNGRAMYYVHRLMPDIQDTLLWGFTSQQMDFCNKYEKRMWEYLVENKKLFITDGFSINQFIGEAPFTKDFSNESPGRSAVWLGYRIVNAYMKRNKDISIRELMMETDYQKILNVSRYNP